MGRYSYSEIEESNLRKYMYPPSYEQTMAFVRELGVRNFAFERFYGLPKRTLQKMKNEGRPLQIRAWHIIYEKIKPTYGSGFLEQYNKPTMKKEVLPVNKPKESIPEMDNHGRLGRLKTK